MTDRQAKEVQTGFFIPDLSGSREVFWLVLVAELFVLILVLALPSSHGFDWSYLALVSLFVQWEVLVCAALVVRLRNQLSRRPLWVAVVVIQSLVLCVTLLCSAAGLWLMEPDAFRVWTPDERWFLLRNLLIALLVSGMLLRYFFLLQQLQLRQRSELETRLNALQARMRPHFLFNTLNSIVGLLHRKPEQAEEALLDLSDLLRASLEARGQLLPLGSELSLCRGYLRIEALRLGERLQVEWAIELPESTFLPPFCLQPLLENAIVHGIAQCAKGGTLRIEGGVSAQKNWLRVSNPLPETAPAVQGHHIAVENIQARLDALFGEQAQLRLETSDTDFNAYLTWPHTEQGE